jgi:hypothetical protein
MQSRKECFGILENVFPVAETGMREVIPGCFDCADKTECLRAALSTLEGLGFREELLERRRSGGLAGLINRWSQKKRLSDLMKQEQRKKK